jgi:hypothetical protein
MSKLDIKPEETALMARWVMLFCHYLMNQKAAAIVSGDFPSLMQIFEEAKPLYRRLRDSGCDLMPEVLIDMEDGKVRDVAVMIGGEPLTDTRFTVYDADEIVTCEGTEDEPS